LAKVAVQCSADTFVVKIATFAKPETVSSKPIGRHNTTETDDLNEKRKQILTGDQHTDHISTGQQLSRHSLPTLLYFLFSPPHIFLIQFLASRTNGTFGFARHTSRPYTKPKEPFFANAPTMTLSI
jgi:hypothetical protein